MKERVVAWNGGETSRAGEQMATNYILRETACSIWQQAFCKLNLHDF